MVHKAVHNVKPIQRLVGLDYTDKNILKVLLENGYFMTTREVAKKAEISWNTAIYRLRQLYQKGLINHDKRGKKELWEASAGI